MTTAEQVRTIRKRLGLTQAAFAHKLGVALLTVQRWEAGRNEPSPVLRQKLRRWEKRAQRRPA